MARTARPGIRHDIFISLRFAEAMEEAKALKQKLEKRKIRVFLCAVPEGESLADAIIMALHMSSLVLILGTPTYGQKTSSPFSTYHELNYIVDNKKPMFLVKMCDEFLEPYAKFHLPSAISYYPWRPMTLAERQDVPEELIDRVLTRLLQASEDMGGMPATVAEAQKPGVHGAY